MRSDPADPLSLWYEYIRWIQENYPEGGEEAGLNKVLESCISDLYNVDRYKNDERFLEIFLQYMSIINDHLEIFQMLFNSDTFVELASFYCHWSARLQESNDYKKAEEVLHKGRAKMARPQRLLETTLNRLKQTIQTEMEKQGSDGELEWETIPKLLFFAKLFQRFNLMLYSLIHIR